MLYCRRGLIKEIASVQGGKLRDSGTFQFRAYKTKDSRGHDQEIIFWEINNIPEYF